MKYSLKYWILIMLFSLSCRNSDMGKQKSGQSLTDSVTGFRYKKSNKTNNPVKVITDTKVRNKAITAKKETKSIEVEIVKLDPNDTCHKMSFFHNDRKYFHNDSLYCELLYKLKEVLIVSKDALKVGDYVTMMVDERPQGSLDYYQIALYRIRAHLDKMDRMETYRINIRSKKIEKHEVVKDKWVKAK